MALGFQFLDSLSRGAQVRPPATALLSDFSTQPCLSHGLMHLMELDQA